MWGAWLAAVWCAGCAGAAHESTARVIMAGSVCSGEARLEGPALHGPAAASGSPPLLAYVTEREPNELVVYDLEQARERFRVNVQLRNRPQLLDDVVVAVDADAQLVAYDLASGALRFRTSVPRAQWLGAVQVGALVISTSTSLSFRPAERGSTITAFDKTSGARVWQRELPYALSRPVAQGERVWLISDHADLWALRASDGDSIGCARDSGGSVDWLEVQAGQLLAGAAAAREVSAQASGDSSSTPLQLPLDQLPGRPSLRPSSYESVPARRSAYGRVGIRAELRPSAGSPTLAAGRYYFSFYRQLFAYRQDGQLEWARLFDSDALYVQPLGEAVLAITESGRMYWLSARDGTQLAEQALSARIASADARVSQLPPQVASPSVQVEHSLRAELSEIALDTDTRLLPGRRLAVSALGTLEDPLATRDLLSVYTHAAAPSELKSHVAAVLAGRRTGHDYLLSALNTHYDFLEGKPAPPLAAIVPALVNVREARALPGFVERLFDPDTPLTELRLLVDGIATLGGPVAQEALGRFFAMYHADSSLSADPSALISAARVLWDSASAEARKLVESVAQDPATPAGLRASIAPLTAAPVAVAAAPAASEAPKEPEPPLPERITDADIARTFTEHAAELNDCIESTQDPSLRALRLSFVIEHDGRLSRLHIWPERSALVQCLKPQLEATRFQRFASGRRLASYTLVVRPDASLIPKRTPADSAAPFWRKAQLRALATPMLSKSAPWWRDQNPLFLAVDEPTKSAPSPAAPEQPSRRAPDTETAAPATEESSQPKAPAATAKETSPTEAPKDTNDAPVDAWWLPNGQQ